MTQFISTSLLLWIKSGSSSKPDHHCIIIIITASAISIKWCYLSILLVRGSSTEPTLFHASCRPSPYVGLPLQSQPFFILDVGLYRASPFSYWMYLHKASPFSYWMWVSIEPVLFHTGCMPLQSQPLFMLDVPTKSHSFFILDVGLYRASPFSY